MYVLLFAWYSIQISSRTLFYLVLARILACLTGLGDRIPRYGGLTPEITEKCQLLGCCPKLAHSPVSLDLFPMFPVIQLQYLAGGSA